MKVMQMSNCHRSPVEGNKEGRIISGEKNLSIRENWGRNGH